MAEGGADPFPVLGSVYRGSGGANSKSNQWRRNVGSSKQVAQKTGGGDSRGSSSQLQNMSQKPNAAGGDSRGGSTQLQNMSQKPNAWGQSNLIQKLSNEGPGGSGLGTLKDSNLPPTLKKGSDSSDGVPEPDYENIDGGIGTDSDEDFRYDSEDDVSLDDTDSESGEKNHDGAKKSKWLRDFFDMLNKVAKQVEKLDSPSIRWHCPVCRGGPGGIDWYHGLQPLLVHAMTILRKVQVHRLFAKTLKEECRRRGAPLTSEACGLWEGLDKKVKDHEIVWPPMVIIMNTKSQRGENNKWTGMGNQELLDSFSEYAAMKARHSYGPQGHRGMSVLIFAETPAGYLEAMRLHKHFKEQGRDKDAWDRCRNPYVPGGRRQLYGYLASREDLENFNQHSGKTRLKYELKSYQEMVESQIKHINDDIQQLDYFKEKAAKEQLKSEVYANTLSKVTDKLRQSKLENRVVRERTKEQQEQNKDEMDAQEKFFLDQIQIIQQARKAKEEKFEKLQDAKLEEGNWVDGESSEKEQDKNIMEMREFEEGRFNVIKIHEDKKKALQKKHLQELMELEKELENEMVQLMEKYTPGQSQDENNLQK